MHASVTWPSESIVLSATLMPQPSGPASGSLPVAYLKSQPDSYANLYERPHASRETEPPASVVVQVISGTNYHQTMSQHSDISGSACLEYPLSQHRYPACPAPGLQ
ncbi:hypothetical protein Tco_1301878 [Tanacetum coccineum]